jgi:hypothetical protein
MACAGTAGAEPTPVGAANPGTCDVLPVNIEATPALGGILARLIDQSPTLERQCLTLAALPHVRVQIRFPSGPLARWCRARARIERFAGGAIHATIEMPVTRDYAELIAHELEHVIEIVEGVDLAARAMERGSGVSRSLDGAFETDRARRTGRQAGAEVYEASRRGRRVRHEGADRPAPD